MALKGTITEIVDNEQDRKKKAEMGLQNKGKPDHIVLDTGEQYPATVAIWPPKGSIFLEPPAGFDDLKVGDKVFLQVTLREVKDADGSVKFRNYSLNLNEPIVKVTDHTLEEPDATPEPGFVSADAIQSQPVTPKVVPAEVVRSAPRGSVVHSPVKVDFSDFADYKPAELKAFGNDAALVLQKIVDEGKLSVVISQRKYLKFEGWQAVAGFFGATVAIEWTKPIQAPISAIVGGVLGYEARAIVYDRKGRVISSAEANCIREEKNWNEVPTKENKFVGKPDFQLKSMAQTRASAKALRNVFAWVVVLAGLEATPADEMEDEKKSA